MGQGILDGKDHVGLAQVRQNGGIDKLDHGVDDRFPVDDHVDLVDTHIEEPGGLDNLEAFVHQRGRVHGDLRPHLPGGVIQGLGRSDLAHLLTSQAEKRPPRRRQNQPPQRPGRFSLQTLPQGVRLAVQGQNGGPARPRLVQDQPSGHDQGFFIGHGHHLAGLHRRQGRLQAHRPHQGVEHHIRFLQSGQLHQSGGAFNHLHPGQFPPQEVHLVGRGHAHPFRPPLPRPGYQFVRPLSPAQPDDPVVAGQLLQHLEGGISDGAGATQNNDVFHAVSAAF